MRKVLIFVALLGCQACGVDRERVVVVPESCRFYVDADGDGYGAGEPTESTECASVPSGYSLLAHDCDDKDARVYLRAQLDADGDGQCGTETVCTTSEQSCNLLAMDCDDQDANASVTVYLDADGDGLGGLETRCVAPDEALNYAATGGDCDDGNAMLNYRYFWDEDGDGLPGEIAQCGPWYGIPGERWYVEGLLSTDCHDSDPLLGLPTLFPDEDGDGLGSRYYPTCDGTVDNGFDCDDANPSLGKYVYADLDGDGHGGYDLECIPLVSGYAEAYSDCNDASPDVWRGGYRDEDGDGYGSGPWGCGGDDLVALGIDCDDGDPRSYRTGYFDGDGDGSGSSEHLCGDDTLADSSGDCDDAEPSVYAWRYADQDGDGLGSGEAMCAEPTWENSYTNADCDDTVPDGRLGWECDVETPLDGIPLPVIYAPCADLPTLALSVKGYGCGAVVYVVTNGGVVSFEGAIELIQRDPLSGAFRTANYSLALSPGEAVALMHQRVTLADARIVSPEVELCEYSVTHAVTHVMGCMN